MTELDLKKPQAPDFTASLRLGFPSLVVINANEIPTIHWELRDPKLDLRASFAGLKQGREVDGATLSNLDPS